MTDFPLFMRRHAPECISHLNCTPDCERDAEFRDRIREAMKEANDD